MARWQASVDKFCYQYLQLEAEPSLPPAELLKLPDAQETLYERAFADSLPYQPPQRYRLRVLKALVAAIENSIDDWEQYALSDNLMSALTTLLATPLPCEIYAAQQKCYVTYKLSLLPPAVPPPTLTLLENRTLISAGGTTGLRTWEAALHLGQFLCERPALVRGKRVLELGTGTGYLSLLCARHLGSSHVVASDGSDDVLGNLPNNFFLNGLQDASAQIAAMKLIWGHALVGGEELRWNGGRAVDVVLGADITYDDNVIPSLVATLVDIFALYPSVEVYIAATKRNHATFEVFLDTCRAIQLSVEDLHYSVTPREEQTGPFYNDQVEIQAYRINNVA
ncbi:Methyltransferase-16, putative [Cordyceps militaris]|uniref:Methyltransferase-16, putative n=1 Tax=Cordyceps militaris TaxID=73501 RepID=A0A2H4ST57_CORMI|nr:Methyltransferase-16, putative [Cordyceps militaris]